MSSSISLSWEDFWSHFNVQDAETKIFLWRQLDLENALPGLSTKEQNTILEFAPRDVKNHLTKKMEKEKEAAYTAGVLRYLRGV